MIVGEDIGISQRDPSGSHDSLQHAAKREDLDISGNEPDNHDGQTPRTLCKLAQEPCSTQNLGLSPSECTCNRFFFDIWSACLLTTRGMRLDYEEWAKTCRQHSLDMPEEEEYPSRRANRVTLSSSAVFAAESNSTFNAVGAVLVARAETAGIATIVVPIAVVLGLAALGAILAIFWIKKRRTGESFGAFLYRRLSFRKVPKIRHIRRDGNFEIDRQSGNTNDFVMINPEPSLSVHWASFDHKQPEYHFPFRNWRSSQIIQQFRRIPDVVPYWGSNPVHIRPMQPSRRFRVDPSGSTEESGSSAPASQPSTIEGAIPPTIMEGDEDVESTDYHPSEEDEESLLISNADRHDSEVFLISKRPAFTLSSNSHSSNSHHFKIIPPTPTESSRSHGRISQVILPMTQLRPPINIPPAPQWPAPVPPNSVPRRPSPLYNQAEISVYQSFSNQTLVSKNDLPQVQVPHTPKPLRSVSPSQGGPQQFTPLSLQTVPLLPQPSPNSNILPNANTPSRSVTPAKPGFLPPPAPIAPLSQLAPTKPYNVQRRPSAEGNDPLNHNVHRRPMGARPPSSHNTRRPSLDETSRFGPTIPSGDSILMSTHRPLTPQHAQSPHTRQRSLSASGGDVASGDVAAVSVLPPPHPTHARKLSSDNLSLAPDDSRLLYPGPVRAGGYNVNLRPDAIESLENLHSRPLPRERTH